jgi:midasin
MSGLSSGDYREICSRLYPDLGADLIERMVEFNSVLNREVVSQRLWGQAGAPWEFNLRDLLR